MRFLHTSDWHLGRLFHGVHLTEDQRHVLDQLVDLARDAKVDAVLIAGDVYDRAVPPPEAVELLDDVLARLVLDVKVPVVMIAGNHDSPQRVGFAARLMAGSRLHVVGPLQATTAGIELADEHGPVRVYPVPYAEPASAREVLGDRSLETHALAMQALLDGIRAAHPAGTRSVLVAHAFVQGGAESESERPLSVGGADRIETDVLQGFSYVALGHLHRPQLAAPRISYSGSLMKYSFQEAEGARSVSIVDMNAEGDVSIERVPLAPRRDVRRVEGTLTELLAGTPSADYLEIVLTDRGPLLDPMGKLRDVYPNALHLDRRAFAEASAAEGPARDHRRTADLDLFGAFFAEATGAALTADEQAALAAVLDDLSRREGERS